MLFFLNYIIYIINNILGYYIFFFGFFLCVFLFLCGCGGVVCGVGVCGGRVLVCVFFLFCWGGVKRILNSESIVSFFLMNCFLRYNLS